MHSQQAKKDCIDRTKNALLDLNSKLQGSLDGYVRSFYIEYDKDVDGWVANLIWEVNELPAAGVDQSEDLTQEDLLFDLCTAGNDSLDGIVAVAYCDYRTSSEYAKDYSSDYWKNTLVDVADAA